MAPIQRVARLAVMVSAMAAMVWPKSLAMGARMKVRMKKSNASSVQPRKPASTAFRALEDFGAAEFSVWRLFIGLVGRASRVPGRRLRQVGCPLRRVHR